MIEIENLNRNRSFSEKEKKGVVFSKDYQVDLDCFQPLIHIHSSLDSEEEKTWIRTVSDHVCQHHEIIP